MNPKNYDVSFWQGKRVFVTSPQTFLGSWTCLMLLELGASVFGYGETGAQAPSLFELSNLPQRISMTYADLRDSVALQEALDFAQADILIHLGDQGFLFDSEKEDVETISRAVLGTTTLLNLLKETASIRSVVVASSDKVYARSEESLSEKSMIGAGGLQTTAKLCSELVALSYRQTFFSPQKYNKHKIALATARLSSAVGGGDFAAGSFVYDAVTAFVANEDLQLKNPNSVRPWIAVLDQVEGLLTLAQKLIEKGPKLSETYNLGASEYLSVQEFYTHLAKGWGRNVVSSQALGTPSVHGRLDNALALADLGWQPRTSAADMCAQISQWYQKFYKIS